MAKAFIYGEADVKRQPGFGAIAGICIAVLYLPLLIITVYSFNAATNIGADWKGFTVSWYLTALQNDEFYNSAILSIVLAFAAMVISTLLATAAALGTARGRRWRGQTAAFVAITTPLVVPEIVTGISLLAFFAAITALVDINFGFSKLLIAHVTFCIPFAYLPIKARLEGMDETLESAAADLYATRWRTFRYVTLPLLIPGISSGAALAFIVSFDDFTITQLIAGPGEATLPLYIYTRIRRALTPEINAMCTLLLLVSFVFIILSFAISRRRNK
jgi:spermidine/putrescine transport system permease protein